MSAQRRVRGGFTLVELLVVVTIIAILMGLLFPAIKSARQRARLTECINNQRQLGMAILHYESVKGNFPPCLEAKQNGGTTVTFSWVVPILQYVDRRDLWEVFRDWSATGSWSTSTTVGSVKQFYCPVDFDAVDDPPFADANRTAAPLSYVVNLRVCRDQTLMSSNTNLVSSSDIRTANRTPLLSERLPSWTYLDTFASPPSYVTYQTGPWYHRTMGAPVPPAPAAPSAANVSFLLPPPPPAQPAGQPLPISAKPPVPVPWTTKPWAIEPSPPALMSNHPDVIVVTFCDGHVDSLKPEADSYDVFDFYPFP